MTSPQVPLFVVDGSASAEEVAALVAVLQAVRASQAAAPEPDRQGPREWSARRRLLRGPNPLPPTGPSAWRASGLPR